MKRSTGCQMIMWSSTLSAGWGPLPSGRSEGESDFVVFHPSKGVLSIEVKAGDSGYRGGNWIQTNRHTGEEKVIDSLGQAAESEQRNDQFGENGTCPWGNDWQWD